MPSMMMKQRDASKQLYKTKLIMAELTTLSRNFGKFRCWNIIASFKFQLEKYGIDVWTQTCDSKCDNLTLKS